MTAPLRRRAGSQTSAGRLLAGLLVILGANLAVLGHWRLHFVVPALGLLALVVVPVASLHRINPLRWTQPIDRWVLSAVLWTLVLMVAGLAINEVLPTFGLHHPLSVAPVTGLVDGLDLIVLVWAGFRPPGPARLPEVRPRAVVLLAGAALAVALSAAGAVRLNNGLGGGLAHFALALDVVVLILVTVWREREADGVLGVTIYGVSLALLLSTSLRSWYSSGHDIQHEMQVFLATASASHWVINEHDPYNACLSLTILPTMFLRWTQIEAVYVFKVVYQMLFALCPVLLFGVVRRVAGSAIASVSVIYFLGFITFFQDMPWLNRQEIGFLFFGALLVTLFVKEGSPRSRRSAVLISTAGMVLSHYSTSYFAFAGLTLAWLARRLVRALARRPRLSELGFVRFGQASTALTIGVLVSLASFLAVWNVLLTRTDAGLFHEVSAAIHSLTGGPSLSRAPEANLTILGGGGGTNERAAFQTLRQETQTVRRQSPANVYPAPLPSAGFTPAVPEANLPPTRVGRLLQDVGLSLYPLERGYRLAAAVLLQVLGPLGLLLVGLSRRNRWLREPDFYFLAVGFLIATVIQIALPSTSVSYGPARSFQQTLFVLSAFMAMGTSSLLPRTRAAAGLAVSSAVAVLIAATDTGLVPQALGGYPPQLNLDNSGNYYDLYYVSGAEVAGITWLSQEATAPRADIAMDPNTFNASRPIHSLSVNTNIYPSALHRDSWVLLSPVNVLSDKTEASVTGYELWYRYPIAFLELLKDRVYDNGSLYVYR